MSDPLQMAAFGLSIATVICFAVVMSLHAKTLRIKNQSDEIDKALKESTIEDLIAKLESKIQECAEKVKAGEAVYEKLKPHLSRAQQKIAMINVGLVPATFGVLDDEDLKKSVRASQQRQFEMIKAGNATSAYSDWTFFGSKKKGDQMVADYCRLMIRAFNSEFDLIRTKMRHNTFSGADAKLDKLRESLDRLAETVGAHISNEYQSEKYDELSAWHDALDKREQERQERIERRKILKEEAKLFGGDSVDDDIEDDLAACEADLKKARKRALQMTGNELAKLELAIGKIERQKEALEKKLARAVSQAQITKAGYIYVISNIGSFGEGVVKIGMTRRLEPMDRVTELGDASVPFRFDVHTLAFVNDAPSVEKALHQRFNDDRVNMENMRKEFFRLPPEEVEVAMDEMGIDSSWYYDCEAKEYRESELIMAAESQLKRNSRKASHELPESI